MSSQPYPDSWQISRGGFIDNRGTILVNQSDAAAQLVYGSNGWATQRVQATVLWSSGAAGLILRANQSGMYYSFASYPQSSVLKLELVSSNLNRATLAQYSSLLGISQAQDYEMIFDANGSNLQAWVNGIRYFNVTDNTLSAGQVGLEWQGGLGQFRDIHIQTNLPDGNIGPVTLPTDFGAYCSVQDVLSLLTGIPTSDIATADDIFMYVKNASDMINRETYSSFGRGIRVEERYDGSGQFTLVLNHSPIVKLYSLQIFNPNNTVIRSWTSTDAENQNNLIVEPNLGTLTIPGQQMTPQLLGTTYSLFPTVNPLMGTEAQGVQYDYFNRFRHGNRNILVNYSYGYQTVPEAIRWATAKIVAALLLIKRGNKDSGGAVQLTMEGLTVSFMHRQGPSIPYGATIDNWEKSVQTAITEYRRRPIPIA